LYYWGNRVGGDGNKLEYVGHSQIIDMLGNVISETVENKEMIFEAILNKRELTSARYKFQFLNDRDSFEIL
jgi:predicted amidohydrolase